MTTLFIIRHGETEWNQKGIHQGHMDSPLTRDGENQAKLLGVRLAGESLRFLSDLQRLKRYRREALPSVPSRCGEIRAALRGFLDYYGGGHTRLKSLDFFDSLAR